MSEDPDLLEQVWLQTDQGDSSEFALKQACDQMASMLAELDDKYLRARAQDVRELDLSVRSIPQGKKSELEPVPGGVLTTASLKIQDAPFLGKGKLAAVAVVTGGPTDHAAILAASAGVPMLFGLPPEALQVSSGMIVTLDPYGCELDTQPSAQQVSDFQQFTQGQARLEKLLRQNRHHRAHTLDGEEVTILVNASDESSLQEGLENGADGCGLFRTELTWSNPNGPLAALPRSLSVLKQAIRLLLSLQGRC